MKKTWDKFHQRALSLIMFLMIFASVAITLKLEKVDPISHIRLERSIPYYIPHFFKFQFMTILASEATDDRKHVSIRRFLNWKCINEDISRQETSVNTTFPQLKVYKWGHFTLWSRLALQVELIVFHEREARAVDFLCFLRQDRGERELNLFPLQKVISSDVILARTICVPVVCVVAWVCCLELSKYVKTNK